MLIRHTLRGLVFLALVGGGNAPATIPGQRSPEDPGGIDRHADGIGSPRTLATSAGSPSP
jgi:hypothetical protein